MRLRGDVSRVAGVREVGPGRNRGISCPIPESLGTAVWVSMRNSGLDFSGPDTGLGPRLLGVREEAGPGLLSLRGWVEGLNPHIWEGKAEHLVPWEACRTHVPGIKP